MDRTICRNSKEKIKNQGSDVAMLYKSSKLVFITRISKTTRLQRADEARAGSRRFQSRENVLKQGKEEGREQLVHQTSMTRI